MPKQVTESKTKAAIGIIVANLVICLIPIGIIAIIARKNPDIWLAPYPQFVLYFSAICMYFAIIVGLVAPLNKKLWIALQVITALCVIGYLVYAYVQQDALLLHVATSAFFAFVLYFTSRGTDDNFYFRYACPLIGLVVALVSVLWFVGRGYSMKLHNTIDSICNVIYLIITIVSTCHLVSDRDLSDVTAKHYSYYEETEEEKTAARKKVLEQKLEKAAAREEKREIRNSDPKVAARKERAKKRRATAGRIAKELFRAFRPGGAPYGSEDWNDYDWGKYIAGKVEGAPVHRYSSFYVDWGYGITIYAHFSPYSDTSPEQVRNCREAIRRSFHAACKHCPYNVELVWR